MRRRAIQLGFQIAPAVVLALSLVGCTTGGSALDGQSPATTTSPSASASTSASGGPAKGLELSCPSAADVSEAVGANVEETTSFGGFGMGKVPYETDGCAFTWDAGQIDFQQASSDYPPRMGLFAALAAEAELKVATDGFSRLSDLGDDAYLDGRTASVLVGDSMLFARYEPADDADRDEAPGADGTTISQPGVRLAKLVLSEQVLDDGDVACDEVSGLVTDLLGKPSDVQPLFGGVVYNEVSFDTKGCDLDLPDGGNVAITAGPSTAWDAWIAEKEKSAPHPSYEEHTVAGRPAFDDGEALFIDDVGDGSGDHPLRIVADDLDGMDATERAALRLRLSDLVQG